MLSGVASTVGSTMGPVDETNVASSSSPWVDVGSEGLLASCIEE